MFSKSSSLRTQSCIITRKRKIERIADRRWLTRTASIHRYNTRAVIVAAISTVGVERPITVSTARARAKARDKSKMRGMKEKSTVALHGCHTNNARFYRKREPNACTPEKSEHMWKITADSYTGAKRHHNTATVTVTRIRSARPTTVYRALC